MRTVVRFAALLQFLARKSFKLDFGIPSRVAGWQGTGIHELSGPIRGNFKAPAASLRSWALRLAPWAGSRAQPALRGRVSFWLSLLDWGRGRVGAQVPGSQSSGGDWS
jgi:hypothetical protein